MQLHKESVTNDSYVHPPRRVQQGKQDKASYKIGNRWESTFCTPGKVKKHSDARLFEQRKTLIRIGISVFWGEKNGVNMQIRESFSFLSRILWNTRFFDKV